MTKREQFNLQFVKTISNSGNMEFDCYQSNNSTNYGRLAEKLRVMDKIECLGLIMEIEASQNQEYYEKYFAIDRSSLSDNDSIEINDQNVVIDNLVEVPLQDMKILLEEWINFIDS